MALAGVSDFNFWNYNHNGTDVEVLSALLSELDEEAGCQDRRPSYPPCPGAPEVPCPGAIQFSRGFVLTGMDGVGADGRGRVYRLTTGSGSPADYRVPSPPGTAAFSVPSVGVSTPERCVVTIASASVSGPGAGPGVWIRQPASAALADVRCE